MAGSLPPLSKEEREKREKSGIFYPEEDTPGEPPAQSSRVDVTPGESLAEGSGVGNSDIDEADFILIEKEKEPEPEQQRQMPMRQTPEMIELQKRQHEERAQQAKEQEQQAEKQNQQLQSSFSELVANYEAARSIGQAITTARNSIIALNKEKSNLSLAEIEAAEAARVSEHIGYGSRGKIAKKEKPLDEYNRKANAIQAQITAEEKKIQELAASLKTPLVTAVALGYGPRPSLRRRIGSFFTNTAPEGDNLLAPYVKQYSGEIAAKRTECEKKYPNITLPATNSLDAAVLAARKREYEAGALTGINSARVQHETSTTTTTSTYTRK